MKYKFLINFIQITISGYLVYAFLESLSVSGPKPNYFSWVSLTCILPYLVAYLLVTLVSRRYDNLLKFDSLVGISLLGSFIFSCYDYVQLVNGIWSNHHEDIGRLLVPTLINLFIFISIAFFIISIFFTGATWTLANGNRIFKQRAKLG